jgi:hypothetical protein
MGKGNVLTLRLQRSVLCCEVWNLWERDQPVGILVVQQYTGGHMDNVIQDCVTFFDIFVFFVAVRKTVRKSAINGCNNG